MDTAAKVYITVTVDWEGEHFSNLHDLGYVLRTLGDSVPVTHYICPAYFFRDGWAGAALQIKGLLRDVDEIGLHIHCYRELINQIPGIIFRSEPNYYRVPNPVLRKLANGFPPFLYRYFNRYVSGRGVPLSAYPFNDICKILRFCKSVLMEELDLGHIRTFRAGGWLANDDVLHALSNEGFSTDSSAVPPEILSQGYNRTSTGNYRDDHGDKNGAFTDMIMRIWGYNSQYLPHLRNHIQYEAMHGEAVTRHTQPYTLGELLEMPNNGGMSDFASIENTMRPLLNHGLSEVAQGRSFFINIGCHHEGESFLKLPLLQFIQGITDQEREHISFVSTSDAERAYKRLQ